MKPLKAGRLAPRRLTAAVSAGRSRWVVCSVVPRRPPGGNGTSWPLTARRGRQSLPRRYVPKSRRMRDCKLGTHSNLPSPVTRKRRRRAGPAAPRSCRLSWPSTVVSPVRAWPRCRVGHLPPAATNLPNCLAPGGHSETMTRVGAVWGMWSWILSLRVPQNVSCLAVSVAHGNGLSGPNRSGRGSKNNGAATELTFDIFPVTIGKLLAVHGARSLELKRNVVDGVNLEVMGVPHLLQASKGRSTSQVSM